MPEDTPSPDDDVPLGGDSPPSKGGKEKKKGPIVIPSPTVLVEDVLWEQVNGAGYPHYVAKGGITTESILMEGGRVKHVPVIDDLVKKGVVKFPTDYTPVADVKDVITSIKGLIHKYCEVSPRFESIAAYYVVFTWVYDRFDTIPYLRFLGDWGSGKSRTARVVGSMCYRPMFANAGASLSAVFHLTNFYRGSLVMDEADFQKMEGAVEMVRMLNCGNNRYTPYLRAEANQNGKFKTKAFDVYCPKVLASRKIFWDEALESRCLTERMEVMTRTDVPIDLPRSFDDEATLIRNMLLSVRLEKYSEVIPMVERFPAIEPRINQIICPIVSVFPTNGVKEEVLAFAKYLNQVMLEQRGTRWESWIAKAIYELHILGQALSLKNIADKISEGRGLEEPLQPKAVSSTLQSMGIRKRTVHGRIHAVIDDKTIETFIQRYAVDKMDADGTLESVKQEKLDGEEKDGGGRREDDKEDEEEGEDKKGYFDDAI